MRKYIFILLLLGTAYHADAQIIPVSSPYPVPTATVAAVPTAYPAGMPVNYIRTWEPSKPLQNDADVISQYRTVSEVKQAAAYTDGLGRPVQSVIKGVSPAGKDIVNLFATNALGQQEYSYLPYEAATGTGTIQVNPYPAQSTFNAVQYPGEQIFYGQALFEPSPLNRPLKTLPVGNSWVGSDRGTAISYSTNEANEVRLWNIGFTAGEFPVGVGYYNAGELAATITKDESGKRVIEYKDKEGKVVLKKVEISYSTAAIKTSQTGWLCTYYVYDDLGNLRVVLPPKAVQWLAESFWNFSSTGGGTVMDELCFRYEYDSRSRMIIKKVPGAGEVYMVYDKAEKPVMTQDANMRLHGQWLVTQYDLLNRPVRTYLWNNTTVRADHQASASVVYNYPTLSGTYDQLSETFYDSYTWTTAKGMASAINTVEAEAAGFYIASDISAPYARNITPDYNVKGMETGSMVKVLGENTYLYTVTFYDNRGRTIQTQSRNITGGIDILTMQYSFDGKILLSRLNENATSMTPANTIILTKNTYDAAGRLLQVSKLLNSEPEKIIVQNEYNANGQLSSKKLSPAYNSNAGLETLTYDYNIRGWLTGINKGYATTTAADHYFGMQLSYDNGFSMNQYNGNIAGMKWKSKGDGEQRAYGFTYDAANRLMKGDFTQNNGGWNQSAGVNFDMKMGDGDPDDPDGAYDPNGNIINMQQWGLKINASSQIDGLTYTYLLNSNKLAQVADAVSGTDNGRLGDFKDGANSGNDYAYDNNGNMQLDNNKAISSIVYNYLNLPSLITITGKGTIAYTYDADGNKLKKVTTDITVTPAKVTTIVYIGNLVFENNILQLVGHEEGRIRYTSATGNIPASFAYDYMLKDYLGNVRAVITDEQKTNHYPTATLEGSGVGSPVESEKSYYDINNAYVQQPTTLQLSEQYANDNGTNNVNTFGDRNAISQKMYRINGSENRTGLGIVLKVMAGDKINVLGKSYYHYSGGTVTNSQIDATSLITSFLTVGGAGNAAAIHGGTVTNITSNTTGTMTPLDLFSSNNPVNSNNNVKAGIAYVILDEQFKYAGSGFDPVDGSSSGGSKDHMLPIINIPKNGYIYIYCSNESNMNVFFDNLEVIDQRSAILEETHYYPFGLIQAGISSKAANGIQNNQKTFQGQQFDDDFGINWVQFKYRNHDPQVGRFIEIDPLSEKYVYNSTYAFSENKVTSFIELEGLEIGDYMMGLFKRAVADEFIATAKSIDKSVTQVASIKIVTENSSLKVGNITVTNNTVFDFSTTTSTNLEGAMKFLAYTNTLRGNNEPLTKQTSEAKLSNETVFEAKTKFGTVTTKASKDQDGVITAEGGATVNLKKVPVTINGSIAVSDDGKKELTVTANVRTSKTKVVASYSQQGVSPADLRLGYSVDKKVGNTTTTTSNALKFSF